jgi:hypothetical protein
MGVLHMTSPEEIAVVPSTDDVFCDDCGQLIDSASAGCPCRGRAIGPPSISAGCPFCDTPFRQGDRGMLIGNVKADRTAELRWVHMRCLARETTGEAGVAAYDAQWGTGWGPDHPDYDEMGQ